jgi:hypothetical protein
MHRVSEMNDPTYTKTPPPSPEASPTRRRHASSQVVRLVARIKELVAEQRELAGEGRGDRVQAIGVEIDRLKRRLASAVRSELGSPQATPCL